MSRILLLGGYGSFGGRIARRLAEAGHSVQVAGRNPAKAERFCAGNPLLNPVSLCLTDFAASLAKISPDIVIDAVGPFQGAPHTVPRACIDAGVHYLDIADARDFVTTIGALDDDARRAGVVVISGASSVPALSGAAVRLLAEGMASVRSVEIVISASNRATAGPSVASAILSYVGKPICLWYGGRWSVGHGWQRIVRESFAIRGSKPIKRRMVALADVPDLDLLPGRLPGRPAVVFRAGTELAFQNGMLWLASWPVRWGWIASLRGLSRWILRLQRLTAGLGGDRSAMMVRLYGTSADGRIERRWTLIAGCGDGPEIPALAVPLFVEHILAGRLQPGARDAGRALALSEFEPAFTKLSIAHEVHEIHHPAAVYARVMGKNFDRLPPAVRSMHDVLRDGGASGQATVTRGKNMFAQLIAHLFGFPIAGKHKLHVHFAENGGIETWTRHFSERAFRSHLSQKGSLLVERFGMFSFSFDLVNEDAGLQMVMRSWQFGPIPLPFALAPRSDAREWQEDGCFHFDVPISLPGIGMIVHYRGWLSPHLAQ